MQIKQGFSLISNALHSTLSERQMKKKKKSWNLPFIVLCDSTRVTRKTRCFLIFLFLLNLKKKNLQIISSVKSSPVFNINYWKSVFVKYVISWWSGQNICVQLPSPHALLAVEELAVLQLHPSWTCLSFYVPGAVLSLQIPFCGFSLLIPLLVLAGPDDLPWGKYKVLLSW